MLFLMTAVLVWPKRRYVSHPVNAAVLFLLFAMAISSVLALHPDEAFSFTFNYFKLLVFYFIIVMTIENEEQLKHFIVAYVLIMLVYVGKSGWEFFLHDRHMYRVGIRRMVGIDVTYANPNDFAASINYSLPFLWAMIRCRFETPWVRTAFWAYGILALVCIVFTGSRSGMVTALLFMVLAGITSSKQISRKMIGVVAASVIAIFVWTRMPEDYQIRFVSTFAFITQSEVDPSASGRITGFLQGIALFKEYPISGIGPGNFYYGWPGKEKGHNPHNLYGQLLGELGLLGFLAFFMLVYKIVRTHRNIIKQSKPLLDRYTHASFLGLISTASIQAIILLLFNGLGGHNLYRYNWLWIGAVAVLASYFLQQNQLKDASPKGER